MTGPERIAGNKVPTESALPLTGVRVLDVSQVMAGPFCSMLLGDMGADVIKIEPPGSGDQTRRAMGFKLKGDDSLGFINMNRNKRSLALNLKSEAGRKVFYRLVETADILVENYRPGVADRLGIGYETLNKINPRLVYASISGFGQTGPWAAEARIRSNRASDGRDHERLRPSGPGADQIKRAGRPISAVPCLPSMRSSQPTLALPKRARASTSMLRCSRPQSLSPFGTFQRFLGDRSSAGAARNRKPHERSISGGPGQRRLFCHGSEQRAALEGPLRTHRQRAISWPTSATRPSPTASPTAHR